MSKKLGDATFSLGDCAVSGLATATCPKIPKHFQLSVGNRASNHNGYSDIPSFDTISIEPISYFFTSSFFASSRQPCWSSDALLQMPTNPSGRLSACYASPRTAAKRAGLPFTEAKVVLFRIC